MQRFFLLVSLLMLNLVLAGFDFTKHSIPPAEIIGGGPPKDGIPAILDPRFIPASEASFLEDQDLVIGVAEGQISKAYPLRILTWHEVVNDRLGEKPVAVTY